MDIPKSLKGIRVAHISSHERIDISKLSTSTNPNKSPKKTNIPLQPIKYHLQLYRPFPFRFPSLNFQVYTVACKRGGAALAWHRRSVAAWRPAADTASSQRPPVAARPIFRRRETSSRRIGYASSTP